MNLEIFLQPNSRGVVVDNEMFIFEIFNAKSTTIIIVLTYLEKMANRKIHF